MRSKYPWNWTMNATRARRTLGSTSNIQLESIACADRSFPCEHLPAGGPAASQAGGPQTSTNYNIYSQLSARDSQFVSSPGSRLSRNLWLKLTVLLSTGHSQQTGLAMPVNSLIASPLIVLKVWCLDGYSANLIQHHWPPLISVRANLKLASFPQSLRPRIEP